MKSLRELVDDAEATLRALRRQAYDPDQEAQIAALVGRLAVLAPPRQPSEHGNASGSPATWVIAVIAAAIDQTKPRAWDGENVNQSHLSEIVTVLANSFAVCARALGWTPREIAEKANLILMAMAQDNRPDNHFQALVSRAIIEATE